MVGMLDRFCCAFRARDAEAVMGLFAPDPDVAVVTSEESLLRGPDKLQDFLRAYVQGHVAQLSKGAANAGADGCVLHASIVLHVDDSAVANLERLRPRVAPTGPVGPREGDDDAIAVLLNRVEVIVVVAGARGRGDRGRENLTGLVRAASGGRRSPEAD